MEKWVLSIVGTVALGVLLDIIMPDGDMNKYIKGVFSIVVITVVVAPLPTFFQSIKNGHIIPPNYGDEMAVDNEFIDGVHETRINELESKIANILMNYDINYNKIDITDEKRDDRIDSIYIELVDAKDKDKAVKILSNSIKVNVTEVVVVATGSR